MRPKRMASRKEGKCVECQGIIRPGMSIYWAKGIGAWHVDCKTAGLLDTLCPSCQGKGCQWNGAPCQQCDGTGSRKEDACARACGM